MVSYNFLLLGSHRLQEHISTRNVCPQRAKKTHTKFQMLQIMQSIIIFRVCRAQFCRCTM
jgi:hypothetical protein